jgi:hypothetical protein
MHAMHTLQVILNLTSSAILQLERTKPTRPVKSTHGTTFPKESKKKDYTNTPPWLQTYYPTDPRSLPAAAAAATVSRNIRCTLA